MTITLRGELTKHRAISSDGWGIGALRTDQGTHVITGALVNVRVGDHVEVTGAWFDHPRFGKQIKVKSCTPIRQDGPNGAVKWMASRFPDVGERRAREMAEHFGEELWQVIAISPERLTEIKGITEERALAINAAYRKYADEREHMITLRGWGLTDGQVARCIEVWGELAEVIVSLRANPYLLGQEVHGFGFLRSDEVAKRMGVKNDAPERLKAGVEHLLEEAGTQGHCYMSGAALQKMAAELMAVDANIVGPAIRAAADAGRLVRRGWRIYTRRMDYAEQELADGIKRLLEPERKAA